MKTAFGWLTCWASHSCFHGSEILEELRTDGACLANHLPTYNVGTWPYDFEQGRPQSNPTKSRKFEVSPSDEFV